MVAKRLVVLTAFAALVGMAVGVATSSAAPTPQTISVLEVDTSFTGTGGFPISSNAPPAVGQGFITSGVLYKWAGRTKGAPVGTIRVVCTVTTVNLTSSGGTAWTHCDASLFLPGGVIEANGPLNLTAGTNNVPVVGGTGAYVGAQGVVVHKNIGPRARATPRT